jgi:sialidase-1
MISISSFPLKWFIAYFIFQFYSILLFAQTKIPIFKENEGGYKCFRIPSIISTENGTLLAVVEGRNNGCSDTGDIDLVMKRSLDGGNTWSEISVLWNDAKNTCGNPTLVQDKNTGRILLLSTWNLGNDHESQIIAGTSKDTRRVFILTSDDEGITWQPPREITTNVKKPEWSWYATGPGNGIQIKSGKYKNRLFIACDHIEKQSKKYFSHVIFSDDGGTSWSIGGISPSDMVNECTIAELPKGKLMLNMRNYDDSRARKVSFSNDGGRSFSKLEPDNALIEPICHGSLISFKKGGKYFFAFSNPASQTSRTNMTVKVSKNQGKTWKYQKVLNLGPSAYSNLVLLNNGNLACLYEAGEKSPYENIIFEEIGFKLLMTENQ